MTTEPLPNDDNLDDEDDFGVQELTCLSCGGEGVVDSVAGESGRRGWDDDGQVFMLTVEKWYVGPHDSIGTVLEVTQ